MKELHGSPLQELCDEIDNLNRSNNQLKSVKSKQGDYTVESWPCESRIDIIGQNGNDGDHYAGIGE